MSTPEQNEQRQTQRLKRQLDEALVGNLQPPGTIMLFAGVMPPEDWAICDGAALQRATYPRLYEVIRDKFGAGDGETTFNLPRLEHPQAGVRYIIRLGAGLPAQHIA